MEDDHYFTEEPKSKFRRYKIEIESRGFKLVFNSAPGVFSAQEIDRGSQILAKYMELPEEGKILDLGCGYGFIGVVAGKVSPKSEIILTDINRRACELAKKNLKENKIKNSEVRQGAFYEPVKGEKFDVILLNPPQTAGKDICIQLISESVHHLNEGGSLQIVARRSKGGEPFFRLMDSLFQKTEAVAKKGGYWVYKGLKI